MKPKIVSEETKYKGRWFDVVETEVDLGNGNIVKWDSLVSGDAVATVAVDDKNNVYLGKEYRVAHKKYIYGIASGSAEGKKTEQELVEQARSELREEFGLNAKRFEKMAKVAVSGRNSGSFHVYMATGIYKDPLEKEEGEFIEVLKLPINEALKLLLANDCHCVALLGILLAKEKLKM